MLSQLDPITVIRLKTLAISNELEVCSICLDLPESATMVPCGHYYCKECIMRVTENEENSNCPQCIQLHDL